MDEHASLILLPVAHKADGSSTMIFPACLTVCPLKKVKGEMFSNRDIELEESTTSTVYDCSLPGEGNNAEVISDKEEDFPVGKKFITSLAGIYIHRKANLQGADLSNEKI